jgi:hypothetical protein
VGQFFTKFYLSHGWSMDHLIPLLPYKNIRCFLQIYIFWPKCEFLYFYFFTSCCHNSIYEQRNTYKLLYITKSPKILNPVLILAHVQNNFILNMHMQITTSIHLFMNQEQLASCDLWSSNLSLWQSCNL